MASVPPIVNAAPEEEPLLVRIARAVMARERQKLGIPQQEQRAELVDADVDLKRAQAAHFLSGGNRRGVTPPSVGSFEDFVLRKYGPNPTPQQIAEARAEWAASGQPPQREAAPPTNLEAQAAAALARGDNETYQRLLRVRKEMGQADDKPSGTDSADGAFASNPFLVTDAKGNQRLAVRVKGGGYKFVEEIGGEKVGPGPTADMRNVEYQSQAVEPAFELVGKSLDTLEQATRGIGGKITGAIPGTQAYYAKTRFQDQARALLGAIVARQAGEGSRLSDEDRKAYSQAATLVNNLVLLPGGVEEARSRLNDAKMLLDQVMQRRRGGGVTAPGAPPSQPGELDPAVQRILDMIRSRNAGQ